MNEEKILNFSDELEQKLAIFFDFYDKSCDKFNLSSIRKREEVYIKHFYDSLLGEEFFKKNAFAVEVGSGGGFPSVVLKLKREDINFTLIEATNKKCGYLNEVKELFGFDNFEVINGRCEEEAKKIDKREKFDVACARGVAELSSLSEYLLPFLKIGGLMVSYKGADYKRELEESKNALEILGGKLLTIKEYDLPKAYGKRAIVVIEKIKATPLKYPRGRGKERKYPL